jgi:hypothetical protein
VGSIPTSPSCGTLLLHGCIACVTRLGTLTVAALVLATACGGGAAQLSAASPSSAPVMSGRWFVDSDPGIPVVGHQAWFFLEFVPDPAAPGSPPEQIGAAEMAVSARCANCNGTTIAGIARRYPTLRPEEFYHPGATAGFSVALTLPSQGSWRFDPSGMDVLVRAVDHFEPPLIHLRPWSNPLPADCGRDKVADLMKRFEHAYNTGDPTLLRSVVQESIDFSIAGGAAPFIAYGRDKFVAGAADRHAQGERIEITLVHVATDRGGIALAVNAIRTAPDLPQGRQRLSAKGAMWCSQPQLIHLNFGVMSG